MENKKWFKNSDALMAIGLLGTLMVMILPMPAWTLDLLLGFSFALSLTILLVAIYSQKPLDFSVFPTVLLFATLFRLALNIASTRQVLMHGHEGTAAAGKIIETFGNLVIGGSYVVGIVIFILLVIINFIVITKGSGRVAEVAARFVLDAMPGKQMSIDADLNAGLINEEQARDRRKKIESEADFYGAMDGASKFVRGDAIAGILITLVNVMGGFAIGILQKGLDLGVAAERYTLMTIGDGLVSQIPAIIVSTAAGIVVTRAASGQDLSEEMTKQIVFQPRAMLFSAAIMLAFGLLPGVPMLPFGVLGFLLIVFYWAGNRFKEQEETEKKIKETKPQDVGEVGIPPDLDAVELQVGYGLVALVEKESKGDLVDRIQQLRREFAKEMGVVVPKVRIKDNLELQPNEYSILIKGVSVAKGQLMNGYLLAMDSGAVEKEIPGISTVEPVFGLQALWIVDKYKEKALASGYTVVDLQTILATHISEIVRRHSHELLSRQELQKMVDHLSRTNPKVVEELNPTVMPFGNILKVCQNLLRENIPIRDMLTILETIANHAQQTKDPEILTEYVRGNLARLITQRLVSPNAELEVLTLDPQVEETLLKSYHKEGGGYFSFENGYFERMIHGLKKTMEITVFQTGTPVLLCHSMIRSQFKKLVERFLPNLTIISASEIAHFAKIKTLGSVTA